MEQVGLGVARGAGSVPGGTRSRRDVPDYPLGGLCSRCKSFRQNLTLFLHKHKAVALPAPPQGSCGHSGRVALTGPFPGGWPS